MKFALVALLFTGYTAAFAPQSTLVTRQVALNVAASPEKVPAAFTSDDPDAPKAVIANLLEGLNRDPDTHQQMLNLLASSTHNWRTKIYDAIGAPASADENVVADALAGAMQKVDNQFAILLGKAEDYTVDFPSDTVEFAEGKCWLECRLYDKSDGELLVVSGWDLQRETISGQWKIDRIDWQDFRDAFYPGLGREEWARAFV